MKTSQRQNVLRTLLDQPLCGTTRDPELGQRLAARVAELRQAGFWIVTVPCTNDTHQHRSRQIQYELREYHGGLDGCAYCGPGPYQQVQYVEVDTLRDIVNCSVCGRKDWRP